MFLQTIVQLHILLAATPALAGWTLLMPSAQSLPTHVYCLVSQKGAAAAPQAVSPAPRVYVIRPVYSIPALSRPLEWLSQARFALGLSVAAPSSAAVPSDLFHPFPHAARAP